MRGWSTIAWWMVGLGAVGALFFVALRPVPVEVDVAQVVRGPMAVTIDDEGETRIRRRFVVSSPVAGRLQRIELEPGDPVTQGQTVVARVQAEAPPLLDARTRAEAEAARAAAASLLGRARADEQLATTALELARRDLAREQELDTTGLTTRQAVDVRETAGLDGGGGRASRDVRGRDCRCGTGTHGGTCRTEQHRRRRPHRDRAGANRRHGAAASARERGLRAPPASP